MAEPENPSTSNAAAAPSNQAEPTENANRPPELTKGIPLEVFYPEYAVGIGLITQAEADALRDRYYLQAQMAFGVIIPTLLLAFVLMISVHLHVSYWIYFLLLVVLVLSFFMGLDRMHKYHSEVQLLIRGRAVAKAQAKVDAEKEAQKPAGPTAAALVADLKKDFGQLKEAVEQQAHTPLNIVVKTVPSEPSPSAPAHSTEEEPGKPA